MLTDAQDWEVIERNFNGHVGRPFHLFAYNSLANRVSIPTLAADLRKFIMEKSDAYAKKLAKVSWSRLTKGKKDEEKTDKRKPHLPLPPPLYIDPR